VLLFRLPRCDALTIGRLGTFDLAPGIYAYVGSALGGLEARVGRHLRGGAKKHWHIDYLIGHGCDRSAYMVVSDRDIECELSRSIAGLPGATMPVRGFGSSDCHCSTHLFCLEPRTMELFRAQMGERGAQLATLNNFE
jgi:Uri superfamily endonuclease